jgi:predicted GIY-YIG superfamily endonuclease
MSRVSGKGYYGYILWSPSAGRFYIGISEDPERRSEQHNQSGRGWSARLALWELVYCVRHPDYTTARRWELKLKSQKRGEGFWTLTGLERARFTPAAWGS